MKFYCVTHWPIDECGKNHGLRTCWFTSKAAAAMHRAVLRQQHRKMHGRREELSMHSGETDIPTGKAGLLNWLNANAQD